MLNIKTWGSKKKPHLILLHGFLGSNEEWQEIGEALSDQYYCIAPSLPGHGGSALPKTIRDFESYAGCCVVSSFFKPGRPVRLLGYSLGGRIALSLLAQYPQRFSHVLIESASAGLPTEPERLGRIHADTQWSVRFKNEPMHLVLKDWYQQPVFNNLHHMKPSPVPSLIKTRMKNNPRQMAQVLKTCSLGQQPYYLAQLQTLKINMAYITGTQDVKFTKVGRHLEKQIKNFTFFRARGCGHNVHLEDPEQFISSCRRFFSNNRSLS